MFSTDSLYPVDDAFQYTLISQVEDESTLNSTYWATKKATLEDSLAVAFLKDLQNTQGLLPTIPYGNLVSTYDQALAAIAFILADEIQCAERIFDYFESIRERNWKMVQVDFSVQIAFGCSLRKEMDGR